MRSQDAEVDVPPVVPAGARREIRPRDETRRCCGDTRRLHALFTSGSSRRRSSRRGRRASASSPQAGRRRAAAEPRPFTRPSGEQVRRRADGAARPGVGGRGGERHPSNCSQLPHLPPPTAAAAPSPPQAYVNGVPTFVLNLVANGPGGQRVYQLGSGLSEQELEWIAAEVNATLEEVESNPPEPLL